MSLARIGDSGVVAVAGLEGVERDAVGGWAGAELGEGPAHRHEPRVLGGVGVRHSVERAFLEHHTRAQGHGGPFFH